MRALDSSRKVLASVPGKIFLAGEYAVLKGGRSLSVAVDAWLHLEIQQSEQEGVWVESNLWPEAKLLTPAPQHEALLDSLQRLRTHNARVKVTSDLDVSFGLGSSSAVRLAAHLAAHAFTLGSAALSLDERWDAAREAWHQQKSQQGFASGYDLVTQLQGGLVLWSPDFENWPGTPASRDPDWLSDFVHPYVGGQGAPTASVGGSVKDYLNGNDLWPALQKRSETLVESFLNESPDAIFAANAAHRALFEKAPFYPQKLLNLLASLGDFDRSWSFKTTGAGGEDAVLLLGPKAKLKEADEVLRREGWRPLPYGFTAKGSQLTLKEIEL